MLKRQLPVDNAFQIEYIEKPVRSTCDELMLFLRGPELPAMMTWASRLVAFFVNFDRGGHIAGTRLFFSMILCVAETMADVSARDMGFEAW